MHCISNVEKTWTAVFRIAFECDSRQLSKKKKDMGRELRGTAFGIGVKLVLGPGDVGSGGAWVQGNVVPPTGSGGQDERGPN